MTADLHPYPAYKPSGVPWLGRVPEHWALERGKSLFERKQRPVRPDDEIVTCFRDGTVTLRKNRRTDGFTNALKEIGYQGVRRGDLVIHVMDAFAGAIGVSDSDGKCTPVYSVCEPRQDVSTKYYAYLLRVMSRAGFIQALAKGIRERSTDFRYDTFGALPFCLPPPSEQDAIVRFLDHYDRLIGKYIRAKQKLIALLTEQKQAIIQHAVTRGLNPDVKLKPSGVDWLGDIPEHWEVRRLRTIADLLVSNVDKLTTPGQTPVRLCNYVDVYKNERITKRLSFMLATASPGELRKFRIRRGDVLVTKDSEEWNDIGVPALVEYESPDLVCGYHLGILRPRADQVTGAFLFRSLQCHLIASQLHVAANGVTRYGLSQGAIKDVYITLPNTNEQTAITEKLETQLRPFEQAQAEANRQIALMREYRTRLIADVVTGKIDVREAAANLPTTDDEPPIADTDLEEPTDEEEVLDVAE